MASVTEVYEALKKKGYPESKAARIAQAKTGEKLHEGSSFLGYLKDRLMLHLKEAIAQRDMIKAQTLREHIIQVEKEMNQAQYELFQQLDKMLISNTQDKVTWQ